MSEFTKGKWETTIINDMIYIVSAHKEIAIICVKPDAEHLYKPIEMEANAQLIAAAPQLLAACEEIVGITTKDINSEHKLHNIKQTAKAAIAAAKTCNP